MIVVILEDAAEDLEAGAQFYESCETGVGDYFLDSVLSDLDSLILLPVFIQSTLDSIVCYRSDYRRGCEQQAAAVGKSESKTARWIDWQMGRAITKFFDVYSALIGKRKFEARR